MVNEILDITVPNYYRFEFSAIRISNTALQVKLSDVTTGRTMEFTSVDGANSYALAVASMDDEEEAVYYKSYKEKAHYV